MRSPRFAWPVGLAAVLSLALVAAACGGGGSNDQNTNKSGSGGNQTLDDGVCVALHDSKRNTALAQICGKHVAGKVRLFLVQVNDQ